MDVVTLAKRRPFVFPLACVAAAAMVFISEGSYRQSVEALDKLGSMQAARTSILLLQQNILAAEAGQRGYLLTDRKEYLRTYAKALEEIDASTAFLKRYYGAEPQSFELLGKLHDSIESKLQELAAAIRLHEQGKSAASTDIVLSALNKQQMDAIRELGTELLEHEELKVVATRTDVYLTLMLSRIGMAALSAISLLALYFYLRQTLALKLQQQELKRRVQAERDGLEVIVAQRTAQLTELTRHLLTAREDERNRLARNLHDELGALLTSAKLDAARIKSRLAGAAPEALERLTHLVGTLNSSIALGRRIIEDLRPSTLSNLGLAPTLEILMREFAQSSSVEVHCELQPVKLDASTELVVYRFVQEAVTNIGKYAKARHVWVTLSKHSAQVEVSVRDDGVGFDTTVPASSAYGLLGMRFRVEAEGGTLMLQSAPGQGTLIQVTLPQAPLVTA
ncbi:MAG: CHASE3 domain-containing protein [Burkholderiaceae bacterium]